MAERQTDCCPIVASQLYPPRSNDDLRKLHQKIMSSTAPDHHKHSLLYYIFLDCKAYPRAAENFAADCYLPDKYATYIEGLWYMDHFHFQHALEKLTEPTLIPTFPEEILSTLAQHAPSGDLTLSLAYYHTVSPALSSPKALETLFNAMCEVSITEAFYFARGQADNSHKHLFESLISYILSHGDGEDRARKAVELINQPFTDEEEEWFESFLTTGRNRTFAGAKDTVMMRRMATGQFSEALEDSRGTSGRKLEGVNWTILKDGLRHGMGPRNIPTHSMTTGR